MDKRPRHQVQSGCQVAEDDHPCHQVQPDHAAAPQIIRAGSHQRGACGKLLKPSLKDTFANSQTYSPGYLLRSNSTGL